MVIQGFCAKSCEHTNMIYFSIYSMEICLYQPDIIGNLGSIIRTANCFGIEVVHVIMPCGFPMNMQKLKRSMMDYGKYVSIVQHIDFHEFMNYSDGRRIVLMTTKTNAKYTDFKYIESDIIMAGSESKGVDIDTMNLIKYMVTIPMRRNSRSLNVAVSVGVVISEAVRQLSYGKN